MACMLPQFIHIRTSYHNNLRTREATCFQTQCVSSTATVVVDVDKVRVPSLGGHSTSVSTHGPLTYVGTIGSQKKTDFEAALVTESLLKSEEAIIAAAAAEAIALAKAAAKLAKDAALMVGSVPPSRSDKVDDFPSEADILRLQRARLTEMERIGSMDGSSIAGIGPRDKHKSVNQLSPNEMADKQSRENILEALQLQHSQRVAVRSRRQTERRARRAKGVEKAAANAITVKLGTTSRRKRAPLQEIDYSDPLRYLRGTTNSTKLLTATEELELSEGIQDLLKLEKLHKELTERFGGEPTFVQWAAAAGIDQKALRRRLSYGTHCKDKMIKSNIRLVISIAKNYQGVGLSIQDLVQEGCRGLVRGAEKFDASKGFKFSTYAHWWIKQAVRKSLSDQSRTIRLPFHMVDATYRVREATKQLYSENGRHPNDEEVAEATGLSMKRLTTVLLTPKAPRSLDQKIGINQNLKPSEVISDPEAETAEDLLMKQFMKQDLEKVLNTLNPREKQVVRWRFGLEDGRMKTLQEIGELMGVSRERIRQIESSAFRKLKNKKRTKNLRQYLLSN
ncbi:hypothetical protein AMTRI_Chr03g50290 [Amborella trichopoda]|uniref:RNA polymerase sigma factor sigB n=1 Tax=Amborella trichopoda TaxID=13333 RepID=UPI0005D4516F|nr:RNA polymerase sigma factor sigB [Amborella trichopoda]|eukprot:XP_011623893.1 RNA polymerase sigma factor sigB [Amborella trichopoda]